MALRIILDKLINRIHKKISKKSWSWWHFMILRSFPSIKMFIDTMKLQLLSTIFFSMIEWVKITSTVLTKSATVIHKLRKYLTFCISHLQNHWINFNFLKFSRSNVNYLVIYERLNEARDFCWDVIMSLWIIIGCWVIRNLMF